MKSSRPHAVTSCTGLEISSTRNGEGPFRLLKERSAQHVAFVGALQEISGVGDIEGAQSGFVQRAPHGHQEGQGWDGLKCEI
jgi:hypothetical protein